MAKGGPTPKGCLMTSTFVLQHAHAYVQVGPPTHTLTYKQIIKVNLTGPICVRDGVFH